MTGVGRYFWEDALREARKENAEEWKAVNAELDATYAEIDATNAEIDAANAEIDAYNARYDAAMAEREVIFAERDKDIAICDAEKAEYERLHTENREKRIQYAFEDLRKAIEELTAEGNHYRDLYEKKDQTEIAQPGG